MTNEQVYAMSFGKLYPLLAGKALRKGRTQAEVDQVIGWMTGYTPAQIQQAAEKGVSYQQFFAQAPALNPDRTQVTGKICGVQIETIPEPLMQDIRRLDKLIDELAKGRRWKRSCARRKVLYFLL